MGSLLRLVRFSLAPSLLGDVAAGAALAGAFLPATVALAFACSLLLFVGGMALNARVDLEEDRRTRPDRPLPAGELTPGVATALALLGLLGAPILAVLAFDEGAVLRGAWLAGMAGLIALYHTPLRRRPLVGPVLLASVRASDLAWGAVAVAGLGGLGTVTWVAAGSYAAYVMGASLVAHQEDRETVREGLVRAGLVCACLAPIPALGVLWSQARSASELRCFGVALLVAFAMLRPLLARFTGTGVLSRQPGGVGALAGQLLGRMAWFTTALAFAAGSWPAGLTALGGLLLVRLLVRWIPPT